MSDLTPFTLRPYQRDSLVTFGRSEAVLDASEMGCGKSLTAAMWIPELGLRNPRILIVAPKRTLRQWRALLWRQFPSLRERDLVHIASSPSVTPGVWQRITRKQPGVFITSWYSVRGIVPKEVPVIKDEPPRVNLAKGKKSQLYVRPERFSAPGPVPEGYLLAPEARASRGYRDMYDGQKLTVKAIREAMRCRDVPPWGRAGTWDLVIADEAHRMCADRNSLQSLVMRKMIKSVRRMALSGTPAGGKPENIWPLLNFLWPDLYRSRWDFIQWYFIVEEKVISRSGKTANDIIGEKNPGELWGDIPCVVRHRLADVEKQLPPVVERTIEIPMSQEQARIYGEFERECEAWLEGQSYSTPLPITQRIRLRQAALGVLTARRARIDPFDPAKEEFDFKRTAECPKIDAIAELISDLPEGQPLVVYTHSSKWAKLAVEKLAKHRPTALWGGGLTVRQEERLRQRIQGEPLVLVAVIAAVAEGVDELQHACHHEVWASRDESLLLNTQAQGRLHRSGQKKTVQRWVLASEGTVDVTIDTTLYLRNKMLQGMYRDRKEDLQ